MADMPLIPPGTLDSGLKVLAMFLGSAAFLRLAGEVFNKVLDRRMKRDEYNVEDNRAFVKFMTTRVDELEEKIDELSTKLDDKRAIELGLKMQVHELQTKLSELDKENTHLRVQLESIRVENHELKKQLSTPSTK
jgi:phage shock protein A